MLRQLKSNSGYAIQRRRSRLRFFRSVLIVCAVLLLIAAVTALAVVWYNGRHTVVDTTQQPVQHQTTKQAYKAPTVDEAAPVGVAFEAMPVSAIAGSNISASVKTRPKAACSITVTYNKEKSPDSGLIPKVADEFGVVMWTWTVEVSRPVGEWPVEVTCAYNDKSGYGRAMLTIER